MIGGKANSTQTGLRQSRFDCALWRSAHPQLRIVPVAWLAILTWSKTEEKVVLWFCGCGDIQLQNVTD